MLRASVKKIKYNKSWQTTFWVANINNTNNTKPIIFPF